MNRLAIAGWILVDLVAAALVYREYKGLQIWISDTQTILERHEQELKDLRLKTNAYRG